ncbi:hypothetical protein M407DRAFT_26777 [Tulasnella calospora MUT 4182]|uniref:Protein kinase domain-containing protein n=1 Tax=Tulasnella calospora MUT 4182 TaxID=1051891 RepID=A0A0C3KQU0_9AGAM|nr:hypothetical protein M407DRAFT_26777 [Tulasnella calospora MUT 4182]
MEEEFYLEHASHSGTTKRVEVLVRVPLDNKLPGGFLLAGIPRYRIDKSRLKFEEREPAARGGQGVVHQATLVPNEGQDLKEQQKVAVKKFELDSETDYEKFLNDFAREITFMIAISHPNIIQLIDFVEDIKNGDAWMVLPWEANGNVREFLQSGEWDIPERISLMGGIPKRDGIPICHGDLKSFNILVNSDRRAVITDFGSARVKRGLGGRGESGSSPSAPATPSVLDFSEAPKAIFNVSTMEITLTGPKYTIRWAAPEVLGGEDSDLPSDIWALGWICWEVVTGELPFPEAETIPQIVAKATLGKLPATRDDPQLNHIISLCSMMSDCWSSDPVTRPDASACWIQVRLMPSTVPAYFTPNVPKVRSAALLAGIGYMHRLQNDLETAESHYRAALDSASLTDDHEAQANAWNELGHVYATHLRNSHAVDSYLRAQQIYSRIGDDNGVAATWNGLALAYGHQSKIREAEEAFIKAEEINSRVGNEMGRADAYTGLGELYRLQAESEKAEKCHIQALEIHTKLGNDLGVGSSLSSLGGVYRVRRKYQEAEDAFVRAQEIGYRSGDDLTAGNASSGLAELYRIQFRYDDAEKAFIDAKQAHARINHHPGVAGTLNGLASVYRAQARYFEAIETFLEAEKLHRGVSNDVGVANAMLGQARVHLAQGAFAEAEELFHGGQAIHARVGNKDGIVNAQSGLGELHQDKGNHAEAEKFFDQAQATSMVIRDETGRARALVYLAEARQRQSKFKEAEETLDEARKISGRIDSPHERAWILRRLGVMYQQQSRDLDAEDCYRRSGEGFGNAGDDRRQAEVLLFLSGLYQCQHKHNEAKESFRQTLSLFTRLGDDQGRLDALDGLLWASLAEENVEDIVEFHRDAKAICARAGLPLSKTCKIISQSLFGDDVESSTS